MTDMALSTTAEVVTANQAARRELRGGVTEAGTVPRSKARSPAASASGRPEAGGGAPARSGALPAGGAWGPAGATSARRAAPEGPPDPE
ncbi:hypothetical protein GCM10027174_21540 [Salinifilum aidingensis]